MDKYRYLIEKIILTNLPVSYRHELIKSVLCRKLSPIFYDIGVKENCSNVNYIHG